MHLKQYQPHRLTQEISATSIIAQIFALYILVTYFFIGSSPIEWSWRDPVLNLLPPMGVAMCVVGLSIAVMVIWLLITRPTRQIMVYCLRETIFAIIAAILLICILRAIFGATLPAVIPSEETAKPGIVLNMVAGYGEEVFFRLLILPILFFSLIKCCRYHVAVICSAIALGLIFALLHQLGTLSPGINWGYFAVRTIMPGIVLSLLFFYRSPTFAVVLHGTAHVLIPFAFLST